jgi:imidazolonepropionase-like amidohydrolase
MVKAGMSPLDVIIAATRVAAEVCGVADEAGTLATGKAADICVVDGDATKDAGSITATSRVYRAGALVYERGNGYGNAALTPPPVLTSDRTL